MEKIYQNLPHHVDNWEYERCKYCGVDNHIGFDIPNEIWEKVIGKDKVVCINCFYHIAYIKNIDLTDVWELIKFYPI
jgi:hypothetical protein